MCQSPYIPGGFIKGEKRRGEMVGSLVCVQVAMLIVKRHLEDRLPDPQLALPQASVQSLSALKLRDL